MATAERETALLVFGAVAALFLLLILTAAAAAQDARYCGPPKRTASGEIARSSAVLRAFARANPCPATGSTRLPCPGWIMDHVRPLASCGCDSVENLQWLPEELWKAKSKWERKAYRCRPEPSRAFAAPP